MPPPGSVIAAKYRIEAELGRGGMGVVYRAVHVGTGVPVALKMLLRERAEPKARLRFEREMELAARLQHPHSVRVLDAGHAEDGSPYLACELLHGETLAQLLQRQGRLPLERVARIGLQVLDALEEAHALGIVHRDIKPANIFMSADATGADFVKVLDFGVAKRPDSASMAPLTTVGAAVGTLRYMAPEQLGGMEVAPASDLYALGLVLGEALSGRPLVDGATPHTMFMLQLSPTPLPVPADVTGTALGPVIVRAIEKELQMRFATAAEMRAALLVATGQAPPRPLHPPPAAKVGLSATAIALAAAAAFALTITVVWITVRASSSADARASNGGDAGDKGSAGKGGRSSKSKPVPRGPSEGRVKVKLGGVDAARIDKAIAKLGFRAAAPTTMMAMRTWNVFRDSEPLGVVHFFQNDAASATFFGDMCEGGTYAIEDATALCVSLDPDEGDERALFDAITGAE